MAFGTLSSYDTLATTQQTVAEFGEDRAFEGVQAYFEAHNAILNEQMNALCERTTERLRRYGAEATMDMEEVDEYGRGDAQKITAGAQVGFPLRLAQINLQWTRRYFMNTTGIEFAAQITGVLTAHRRRMQRDIKRAVFTPINASFTDRLVDSVVLPLKAFANADSAPIPPGPNGESFDGSTHTHYLARAGGSLAASDVTNALETVREHWNEGQQMLYINRAQETAVRGFTGFVPYTDARIVVADNSNRIINPNLNLQNLYNRAIGVYEGAEVWVKPWIPANYLWTWINGAPKPLAIRERRPGAGNLIVAAEDEQYPLRAQMAEAEYGVSVWQRTNGAVLYAGGTTYVAPTL